MNKKTINVFIITSLVIITQFCRASAEDKTNGPENNSILKIHLPRQATVKGDTISLGQVCIIRGEESLVDKAGRITLGKLSVPGQEIVIDKTIVLSRLACSQIPDSKVILTGAEKITVKQQARIIKGEKFVEMALTFLQKNPIADPNCRLSPVRIPKDLIIPQAYKNIKFSTQLISSTKNQTRIQITILADGKEIGVRRVTFSLRYCCRSAVTLVDIPAATIISPKNVKIVKTLSHSPQPANWNPPYGLIATRPLPANTVIGSHMVGPVKPPVIVERNQTVLVQIERPGLSLTTTGKAAQKGRAGDYIKVKVQITDTPRTIIAKVNEDGSVEPVF